MDFQEYVDRQQIRELMTAYTRAVDTSSWDALEDVFADDAVLDYTSPGGPVGGLSQARPFIRNIEGFDRWQHLLGQIALDYDPVKDSDYGCGTAYFFNPMVARRPDGSDQVWEVGGYYHFEAVRTDDGWRLSKLVDEIVWSRTDQA